MALPDGSESRTPDGGAGPEEGAPLLVDRRGPVLRLTLNRPHRLNAVALPVYRALIEALADAERDGVTRAVLITGAGRAFSVGADLKAHGTGEPTAQERVRYVRGGQQANRAIQRSPLPVIAAVNGHAVGAGLELALSADLLVVASEAKLRFPEAALGTFVGGGVTYSLPRRVGMARARELLLLARFFTPDEALEAGLVNRVVPATEVLPAAHAWAAELASRAPRSVALLKDLLGRAFHEDPDRLLRREEQALLQCMGTADWHEGIRAFHEKREPRFTGA
jgi:enoyl-CoA hydratase/carnithine racemase